MRNLKMNLLISLIKVLIAGEGCHIAKLYTAI